VIPLLLPKLSISMEEGKVLSWLVANGAEVRAGQPVVEVETDKATMEVEAPADGRIRIVVEEGASVGVESVIAEILSAEEERAAPPETEEPHLVAPPPLERPGTTDEPAPPERPPTDGRKAVASPAARRLAADLGVDLETLRGSGPGGRIVAADIEAAAERGEAAPEPVAGAPPGRPARDIRAAVLRNIVASWQEIPHIHIGGELAADGLVEARRRLAARGGERPTVTDLLLLAVARALLDVPELNGTLGSEGQPQRAGAVHLALAVAAPSGLVAPVVRDVADLGLGAISRERARVVAAAREGTLDGRDLAGATCTLSNLGAFPVDFFVPVVSGPQIALVATGRVVEKPVAIDGMLAVRNRMWVNVAVDHRGADGEAGGRFLAALERRIADLPGST
jgi:pyruvate dehydrogenase E2 component (dihydrolipoamide acetyltransferase)